MPIRPRPFTLACRLCNWSHTFAPRSDAFVVGLDTETHCPRCGAAELRMRQPSLINLLSSKLKTLISP
ncbi:hypothetical protein C7R54_17540 [Achromobacter aloeverae]|uniref:Uncharacterized protein n=1 Tax=Achromobacter aloeverae TaxID=1750518 RepID=A0A4Q1HH78_9BURK|nr:hypothetical protein C7R54_17540 [Achromobacter aloeverae]